MKKAIITLSILCGGLLIASPINNDIFAQGIKSDIVNQNIKNELVNEIDCEQAQEILKNYNQNVNYVYQGDENTFEVLKEKSLSGYVFLPDVEGDLGMFVDKNTSEIYYFHPSGYLELA